MSKIENERAFPHNPTTYGEAKGLTLRDYFAAKAISDCLTVCATNTKAAEEAYKIADAMLEARK